MTLLRYTPLLLLVLLLSACGGSSSSSGSSPDTPPPEPETPHEPSDDLVDLVLAACADGAGSGAPEDITGMGFSERADDPAAFAPCFDPAL